ncbi:hypothetical protein CSW25_01955 [Thermus scotoductus]|uniref:DUF3054 domain-containing protein n=1 Tax=Thermus scotoductus TaxID=37636 RepID=A0A430SDA2_THESC|nr:DUF3054 domain-containing protein [Thermus scotoductus]RTG93702.1 hypothetical protein CSW49_10040 [Thermus scotoductus]RTG97684.1 hypothetical protein CSW48_01520 [Thermus scotoductus]RTH07345.1 hypothetical protein CSW45_00455 [Thermus scotoductus]RTH13020.1 hypothetical protein CSW46_00830 [Thermus scotoductus]RTH13665.1 hypothetical protein CSW44_01340 [Thermus scotoductus]
MRLFFLDLLALLLFAWVGLRSHGLPVSLEGLARNVLPILFVWLLLSPFLGTYRRPSWSSLLLSWLLAVPAGLWLRGMILGEGFGPGFFVFLGVAMGFSLLFLLLLRGLAKLLRLW